MEFFLIQQNWLLSIPRTPFWDFFFRLCVFFDTEYFIFVIIPFIWYAFSPKTGLRLFYILLFSSLLNVFSKDFFQLPRPCTLDPSICLVKPPLSFGFPSGAAQTAMLLGLLLFTYTKNRYVKLLSLFYIVLVSFSRLYLNVHYPIDILGGWFLGFFLFTFYKRILPSLEKFFQKKPLISSLRWGLFTPLIVEFLYPDPRITYIMHSAMGVSLGAYLFYRKQKPLKPTFYKGIFAVASLFFWAFLIKTFPLISKNSAAFLLGIWVSFGSFYFLSKIKNYH